MLHTRSTNRGHLCKHKDCAGQAKSRGLCNRCYQRWYERMRRVTDRLVRAGYQPQMLDGFHRFAEAKRLGGAPGTFVLVPSHEVKHRGELYSVLKIK